MSTTHLRSLIIVEEDIFGSLDAATGLPDRTIFGDGVVWDIDRASITTWGEHPQNDRDDIRAGFHGVPADPETIVDGNGDPIQRRTGEVQVEATVRTFGTADPSTLAWAWALAAGLTPLAYPTNRSVTVGTEVGSAQFGVPDATAADIPTGTMLAYLPGAAGPAAFGAVVKKDSDAGTTTVSVSPVLPKATLEVDDVIRQCATWGSLPGRTLGKSVAFRGDGHGFRQYAHGCRLRSLALKSEGRRLRATLTFDATIIQSGHDEVDSTGSNIARAPTRPAASQVLHTLGADVTLSDITEGAGDAPRVGGRTVICPDEWSVTITNTLTPVTCWGSILGMSEMEVTDRMCEVSLTLATPLPALADDYLKRQHRTLAMAWGPAPGLGLILPAAYLTADPSGRELGGDRVRQVVTFREGLPLEVTALPAENDDHLANSPILLGFGLTPEA